MCLFEARYPVHLRFKRNQKKTPPMLSAQSPRPKRQPWRSKLPLRGGGGCFFGFPHQVFDRPRKSQSVQVMELIKGQERFARNRLIDGGEPSTAPPPQKKKKSLGESRYTIWDVLGDSFWGYPAPAPPPKKKKLIICLATFRKVHTLLERRSLVGEATLFFFRGLQGLENESLFGRPPLRCVQTANQHRPKPFPRAWVRTSQRDTFWKVSGSKQMSTRELVNIRWGGLFERVEDPFGGFLT